MNTEPRKGFETSAVAKVMADEMARALQFGGSTATERRGYKEPGIGRTAVTDRGYNWATGPIYVSAKRTHRFAMAFSIHHLYLQTLTSFAEGFCRWVRFGKRTQNRGCFGVH